MRLVRWIFSAVRERHRPPAPTVASGSSVGGGGLYVQYYVGHYHGPNLTVMNLVVLAGVVLAAALAVELLGRVVPPVRGRLRARRLLRRRLLADANVERRARALMSELCPQGWRAQITLYGPSDTIPEDAPEDGRVRVALDWAELEDDRGRVAVVRRVWAPSIAEALEAMVADRRTDETLEQIERGTEPDGAPWPDIYL